MAFHRCIAAPAKPRIASDLMSRILVSALVSVTNLNQCGYLDLMHDCCTKLATTAPLARIFSTTRLGYSLWLGSRIVRVLQSEGVICMESPEMADLEQLLQLCAPCQIITDEALRTLERVRKRVASIAAKRCRDMAVRVPLVL